MFLCYYAEYAHMLGAERCSTPATGTWCEKTDWNDPVRFVVMENGCNSGDFLSYVAKCRFFCRSSV